MLGNVEAAAMLSATKLHFRTARWTPRIRYVRVKPGAPGASGAKFWRLKPAGGSDDRHRRQVRLRSLCAAELTLCGVKEGEVLAVLTQGDERRDYADAFLAAAEEVGATPFHVRLPRESHNLSGDSGAWTVGATPLADNRPALEALKSADIMIDTLFLLFSREQLEIQEAGTRILLCIEPIEHLVQLFPSLELRERVEFGGELLGKASEPPLHEQVRHRRALPAGRIPRDHRVWLHRRARPLGPLAVRLPVHRW